MLLGLSYLLQKNRDTSPEIHILRKTDALKIELTSGILLLLAS